jgi:basic membrane protein A
MVTDTGGVDDKGFNQISYAGMQKAEAELGVTIDLLESSTDADYAPNLQSFADKGCNITVTVGFLLGDATKAAAEANAGLSYAIVDYAYDPPVANARGLVFATDQPSFMAGYLSAAMSQTGIVGTFGGINIPPVTIFMEGFRKGVEYYNTQKGASVKLLGWDGKDGTFAGNFESLDDGKNIAKSQADEGADIIFPVAGPVGLGSAQFALESGGKVKIIGVDVDMSVSNPDAAEVYIASVLKNIDAAVFASIKDVVEGNGVTGEGVVKNADGTFSVNTTELSAREWHTSYTLGRRLIEGVVYDASFVKLRELRLGYTLPNKLFGNSSLRDFNVSLVGRNLALWTEVPHIDPETSSTSGGTVIPGVESVALPSVRSWGVNVNFRF